MTDSEKLDLILSKLEGIDKRLNKLEVGQSELKRELYKINRKIDDTYNLSLDALGMSAENREWLESGTLKSLNK